MTTGARALRGSRKWLCRMKTGSLAPAAAPASHADATPSCTRPVGIVSRTTAHVTCTDRGCAGDALLME